MGTKTVTVSDELFKRVQRYAVPLEDTFETVVARLCDLKDTMMVSNDEVNTVLQYARMGSPTVWRNRQHGAGLALMGRAKSPYEVSVDGSDVIPPDGQVFRTSRSVYLPVGAPLMGEYQGQRVMASIQAAGIEFGGEYYDNPSSAAVAAKISLGATEKAAQTNGWKFWMIELPAGTGAWQTIDVLREEQNVKRSDE